MVRCIGGGGLSSFPAIESYFRAILVWFLYEKKQCWTQRIIMDRTCRKKGVG
jgi:hypothetical protein